MKFLVDVNASGPVARWLANTGHDVRRVAERNPRMRDEEILRWAVREQRIIVTTDQDFEKMIWREGKTTMEYCAWKICLAQNESRCWKM